MKLRLVLGAIIALLLLGSPAAAHHKGDHEKATDTRGHSSESPGKSKDTGAREDVRKHQQSADSDEHRRQASRGGASDTADSGASGTSGKSPSTPDQDGIGADHGVVNDDKKEDGNNGCGNDSDFEDDNNGRCRPRHANPEPEPSPPVVAEPTPVPTPKVTPPVGTPSPPVLVVPPTEEPPATPDVPPGAALPQTGAPVGLLVLGGVSALIIILAGLALVKSYK